MRRLFVDKITSIGAVEQGDNPLSRILLFKSREHDADSAATKEKEMDIDEMGLDLETRTAINDEFEKLRAEIAELKGESADVMKDASESVRAEFAKQQETIDALQKAADDQAAELEKERDAALTAELTQTASKFTELLGDADEAAAMLKVMGDEAAGWLVSKLEAINGVMAKSVVFEEVGKSDAGDPADQIAALAKQKQEDNPTLTDAQARALVRTERPDLKAAEREDS